MIETTFLGNYAPLLVVLVAFILIFSGLKILKIPGSDWTLAVLSLLVALIFVSSENAVQYIFNLIPLFVVLMIIAFVTLLVIVFVAKDTNAFRKPLATIGFVLAILLALSMAFNQFPVLNHMLPYSSNEELGDNLKEFKEFIYSEDFKESLIFVVCVIAVGIILIKKS